MPNDLDELREIERLLREAEAKLESVGTFRQRTLLQMALFEVGRRVRASGREDERPKDDRSTAAPPRDEHGR
ncbi:hypothetical protein [Methylorubrum zatmanii]|uniref:IS66 family transposase n=1 Tax=Methylorubrum zatmanii TaxID=29429 RepID=A0ABW1WUT6_9HYPH|nr:hypothetical protein [Methylorubrum zatmanii]